MQFLEDSHGCAGWNGEMAERIRAFDWSRTELGNLDSWPRSLNSSVQLMLASPLPMVMLWGRPGYMIYNDAYSKFAGGRHPYLLGSPVELGWPEVAEFNRHVVDTCLAGGTLAYRGKELVLLRDGVPATNHPNPWRLSTMLAPLSSASARRTVTRLTPYAAASSDSEGSRPPSANSPVATRPRSSSAICWYRS